MVLVCLRSNLRETGNLLRGEEKLFNPLNATPRATSGVLLPAKVASSLLHFIVLVE
jgi:hypothetical protein